MRLAQWRERYGVRIKELAQRLKRPDQPAPQSSVAVDATAQRRRRCIGELGRGDFPLYHLTHCENLRSILELGLLPKNRCEAQRLDYEDVSLESVQSRRHARAIEVGHGISCNVHDLVPFFFTPLTPMARHLSGRARSLCLIVVHVNVFCDSSFQVAFTDGNIASPITSSRFDFEDLGHVPWTVIDDTQWANTWPWRIRRAAEFLVAPRVSTELFARVEVADEALASSVRAVIAQVGLDLPVVAQPASFFPV